MNNKSDKTCLILIGILLLGGFLRIFSIGSQSLWLDEIIQLNISRGTLSEMFDAVLRQDNTPPLYHIIVNLWARISTSENMIRLPSALFGILTLYTIFLLASALYDRRTGLVSALILAVSPFHVWYSQELRSYTLLMLLTTLSFTFFWKGFAKEEKRFRPWYLVASLLGLYTHSYFGVVLIAQNLYYFIYLRRSGTTVGKWLLWMGVLMVGYIPGIIFMLNMLKHTIKVVSRLGGERPFHPLSFFYIFYVFVVGYSLGPAPSAIQDTPVPELIKAHIPVLLFLGALFASLVWLLVRNLKKPDRELLFLLFSIFVQIIIVPLITILTRIKFNVRYVCFAFPLFIVLLAFLCLSIRKKIWRLVFILVLAGTMLFSLGNYYFNDSYGRDDVRGAARYLDENVRGGDFVIVTVIKQALDQYRRSDYPVLSIGHSIHWGIVFQMEKHERIWWVDSRRWEVRRFDEKKKIYMKRFFNTVSRKTFRGIEIALLERKETPDPE